MSSPQMIEKIQKQKDAARRIVKYFETATLPAVPFNLFPHLRVNNVLMYVTRNVAVLQNAEPLTRTFTASYMHLYHLKQYINAQSGEVDSKA